MSVAKLGDDMPIVNFSEVPAGSIFWEKCGDTWAPSQKLDADHARYQTNCGLPYGDPYAPKATSKVKVSR